MFAGRDICFMGRKALLKYFFMILIRNLTKIVKKTQYVVYPYSVNVVYTTCSELTLVQFMI